MNDASELPFMIIKMIALHSLSSERIIKCRARMLFEQNGRPTGRALDYWLQAEADHLEVLHNNQDKLVTTALDFASQTHNKQNRPRKNENMNATSSQTTASLSRERGAKKSTPITTASVPSAHQSNPPRKTPSHEVIARKAYEIWLSQGQPQGCDQTNWFEAELQLQ
jgi:Protein of unknown function (DUF2934)